MLRNENILQCQAEEEEECREGWGEGGRGGSAGSDLLFSEMPGGGGMPVERLSDGDGQWRW